MKIEIVFKINKKILLELASILDISFSKIQLLDDANSNLILVQNHWEAKKELLIKSLNRCFNGFIESKKIKITVSIVPQYYYVGASNTFKNLIIFGQPLRTDNFSSAIIAHEVAHIFLSKIKTIRPVIVDEIICFMMEDHIYSIFDRKSLADIWRGDELDIFHFNAMKSAISDIEKNGSIVNRNISEVINNLIKQSDNVILGLKPKKGLIKNINLGTKRIIK